jgi:hypothetical protein
MNGSPDVSFLEELDISFDWDDSARELVSMSPNKLVEKLLQAKHIIKETKRGISRGD